MRKLKAANRHYCRYMLAILSRHAKYGGNCMGGVACVVGSPNPRQREPRIRRKRSGILFVVCAAYGGEGHVAAIVHPLSACWLAGRWTCSTGDKGLRQRHSTRKAIGSDFIRTIRRWRSRDARTHRATWRRIGCSIRPRRYYGDCHSTSTRDNRRRCKRTRIRILTSFLAHPICHNFPVCGGYKLSRRKQIVEEYAVGSNHGGVVHLVRTPAPRRDLGLLVT